MEGLDFTGPIEKEIEMKCPNCGGREAIEIDMHSEGFSAETSPVKECGTCGLVWRIKVIGDRHELDIIKKAEKK